MTHGPKKQKERVLVQQFVAGQDGQIRILEIVDRTVMWSSALKGQGGTQLRPVDWEYFYSINYKGRRWQIENQEQTVDGKLIHWTLLLASDALED